MLYKLYNSYTFELFTQMIETRHSLIFTIVSKSEFLHTFFFFQRISVSDVNLLIILARDFYLKKIKTCNVLTESIVFVYLS